MLKGGVFQCLNIRCTSKKRFTTFSGIKAHMGQCCRTRCDAPVDQKTEDYINEEDAIFCPETDFCEMPSTPDTLPEIGYVEAILEENLCTVGLPSHYHNEIYGMGNWPDCNDDNSTEDEILPTSICAANNQNGVHSLCQGSFSADVAILSTSGRLVVQKAERPKVSRVPSDLALLDLARLLDAARCPHYMFDKILSWCKYAGEVGCDPALDRMTTRNSFFTRLENRLAGVDMRVPQFQATKVQLETANVKGGDTNPLISEINHWDFAEQLRSLLSDHSIFGDLDNLNVNSVNSFLPMRDCKKTGAWYQDTVQVKHITGYDGNFLVGIVLAADRTGNTWNQRFGTEPILFTLSIIKEHLWHQPKVWRVLAMIPCDKDYKGQAAGNLHNSRKEGKGHSCRNYHAYLRVALESLKRVQTPTHLYWPYNHKGEIPPNARTMYRAAKVSSDGLNELCTGEPMYNNVPSHRLNGVRTILVLGKDQKMMNIVCCVSHVLLDGEGADKFTCRHVGKKATCNRISRGCDCTFEECDDPFVDCHPVSQARIVQAYFQTKWSDAYSNEHEGIFENEMVNTCAVHACENALWTIDFGFQPNGMYSGPLTIDSLHAFEEGNNKRILTLILGEQNTSHGFCTRVDRVVDHKLRIGVPKQGSMRRLPRMSYSRGISSLSHLAAHERVGVMCALTLVTISLELGGNGHFILGRNPDHSMTKSERRQVVMDRLVFCQLSLLYHCWVDNGPHEVLFSGNTYTSNESRTTQKKIREGIALIGELQKMVFPREQGDGHNTQKFHDWYVHMLPSLIHAGNGRRIKADVSEKQHKYFCKAPGETAAKHSQEIFLKGVCNRLRTTDVLNQTRALFELNDVSSDDETPPQKGFDSASIAKNVASSASFTFLDTQGSGYISWKTRTTNKFNYPRLVKDMLIQGCLDLCEQGLCSSVSVNLYTELNVGGVVLRCHPEYRKNIGPWFDWVMVRWSCNMKKEWRVASALWKPPSNAFVQPSSREVLLSLHDHLEESPAYNVNDTPAVNAEIDIFVPARIIAFVEGNPAVPNGPRIMYAIIQTCESECYTDSILTRRWKKVSGPMKKVVQVVEVASIACPCLVIESLPGFDTVNSASPNSMIIHEVFDRKTSWGKRFLQVVNRGVSTTCHRGVKSELDKMMKRKVTPAVNTPHALDPIYLPKNIITPVTKNKSKEHNNKKRTPNPSSASGRDTRAKRSRKSAS